ncbi:MAG: LON peptidase substrate-binding domain-containing protein [Cellvibrionaceae bacterium]
MEVLPLFPLHSILFPGCSLPLQIFEQRYLELIKNTLKDNRTFGIVPIKHGSEVGGVGKKIPEIYMLGTEVEITDWTQLSNGLLGVTVSAKRRFRVCYVEAQPNQLLIGDIEFLDDESDMLIPEALMELKELREALLNHKGVEHFGLGELDDSLADLTWQLGQLLPVSDEKKVELLLVGAPEERALLLAEWLADLSGE